MTKSQERTIKDIKSKIPHFDYYNRPEEYEIKEWKEFEPYANGMICFCFETGMKNDEGTMAAILCRKHRQFWVGKNGGVYVMNSKNNLVHTTTFKLMNEHYSH